MFAEDEAGLLLAAAASPQDLEAMAQRRIAGLPLEQVLGWAEFSGLRIAVGPGVFVPRRRTELLARLALAAARMPSVAIELCCGAAAVAVVLGTRVPGIELHATDVEPAAVRCARRNLAPFGGTVGEGDLYRPLPGRLRGRVDVLVANAPYVPTAEIALMPPEAREHEPRVALDGGTDGLDVLRRVVAGASGWLAPRGRLLVETGELQAPVLAAAVREAGLVPVVVHDEDLGATAVSVRRSGDEEG